MTTTANTALPTTPKTGFEYQWLIRRKPQGRFEATVNHYPETHSVDDIQKLLPDGWEAVGRIDLSRREYANVIRYIPYADIGKITKVKVNGKLARWDNQFDTFQEAQDYLLKKLQDNLAISTRQFVAVARMSEADL